MHLRKSKAKKLFKKYFKDLFWCGPFLKSLLNLLQYWFSFMFWFFDPKACGILPSSPTRDQTHTLCIGRWSLNHWTVREVPNLLFKTQFIASRYRELVTWTGKNLCLCLRKSTKTKMILWVASKTNVWIFCWFKNIGKSNLMPKGIKNETI